MTESTRQTTIRFQLQDECRAMLMHMSARGIVRDLPNDGSLALIDALPKELESTPIHQIIALHQVLAGAVAPALPETLLKMKQYKEKSDSLIPFNLVAPLPSIVFLFFVSLVVLIGLVVFLFYDQASANNKHLTVLQSMHSQCDLTNDKIAEIQAFKASTEKFLAENSNGPAESARQEVQSILAATEKILDACEDQGKSKISPLPEFILLAIIGMLGATYASIYDSFRYIREGRFDTALSSTYVIRIFLGGFSGVLLAKPLADQGLLPGAFSTILLAFVGGFAAQLVYDLLNKVVDSVANLFRADLRTERMAIQNQAELNARAERNANEEAARKKAAGTLKEAQKIKDPEKRADALQAAIMGILAGETEIELNPESVPPDLFSEIERECQLLELARHLPDDLPEEYGPVDASAIEALLRKLTAARAMLDTDANAHASVELTLAEVQKVNPVRQLLTGHMPAFVATAGPTETRMLSAAAVLTAARFDAAQIARWHWAVYHADPASMADLVADCDIETLSNADDSDALTKTLKPILADSDRANVVSRLLAASDLDGLYALVEGTYASRAEFDVDLERWAEKIARRKLVQDLGAIVVPSLSSDTTAEALLDTAAARGSEDAGLAAMQALELVAVQISHSIAPDQTLASLLALIATHTQMEGDGS